jgi:hypothetical protein
MSVKVERVPNEPVIIATLVGPVTAETVHEVFEKSARLAEQIPGRVYRITDVRFSTTTFKDMATILKEAASQQEGSAADPRFCGMLVGSHEWSRMYSKNLQNEGGFSVPVFDSFDEAMRFVAEQRETDWQQ